MADEINPYDSLLDDLILSDINRRKVQQNATLTTAVDANPDQYAAKRRVAGYLGYPVAAVEATPEASDREFKIKRVQADTVGAPPLQRAYTDDDFARLAHGDSGSLRKIYDALGAASAYVFAHPGASNTLGGDLRAGVADASRGSAGLFRAGAEYAAQAAETFIPGLAANEQLGIAGGDPLRRLAEGFALAGNQAKGIADRASPPTDSLIQGGVSSGVRSAIGNTLMTPAALVNPELALVAMAAQQGGSSYQDAREQGVAPERALPFAASQAVIEYATEKLPLHKLIGDLNTAAPVWKTIAHQIAAEVPGEQLATILQDMNEWAVLPSNKDKSFKDYLAERPSAAAQTLIATVIGIGGNVAVGKAVHSIVGNVTLEDQKAEQAKRVHESLQQMMAEAKSNKLRERAPDVFSRYVQDSAESIDGAPTHVYVNGETFAQSVPPEVMAALPAAITDQLAEARTTGGDIVVPVGDLAAYLSDVPALAQHIRTEPDAPTAGEAEAYSPDDHLRQEVERAALPAVQTAVEQTPQQAAIVTARQQIDAALAKADRFTPQVNKSYGDLLSAFISATAERSNLSPEEIVALAPKVVAQHIAPQDTVLSQDGTARGLYQPSTRTIVLLKDADLSTFLHESGHFFLDATVDQALRAAAPDAVKADVQTLMTHFGVKDAAAWKAMSLNEQREHHEQFARSFEKYLGEGKAPSAELATLFGRFRSWLLAVYQKLSALNVELTPEVRGVLDRMLASDAQIAETQARRSLRPLFESAEAAGMTPAQFAEYQALGRDATEDAVAELQSRSIRDLQFIASAKARETRRLNREAKAKRDAIEAEVTQEVYELPIYAAWRDLQRGHTQDGEPIRLSRADVEQSNPELVDRMPFGVLANSERAMPADMVASLYGLRDGGELLHLLSTLDKPADLIEGRTDHIMLQRHGELADDRAIETAAHAAIANDARARVLTTESNALAKAVGSKPILTRAAKEFAAASVAGKKVRDLRPGQFSAAETRAGREAEAAHRKGNVAAAAAAKRAELLQHVLARATSAARTEVETKVDALRAIVRASTLPSEYQTQIDQLLERFDLKEIPLKQIDRRKSLASWVESQQAVGLDPQIDPALLAEASRQNYRDMTVEEFRGLYDAVKQIEHLGRLKNKLLTAKDSRDFEDAKADLVASINSHAGGREADTRTPATSLGRSLAAIKGFGAAHIKAATWARILDGGIDGGPMWERIVRPANEAGDQEVRMRADAAAKVADILAPVLAAGKMHGSGKFFPSVGRSFNREALFAIALNTGNESNLQRLLGGENWTREQIKPLLAALSPAEWAAVQAVWDHFESYRPAIAAKQKRVYGTEPNWIEPGTDVAREHGVKGGYYPIKYDPAASIRAEEHADAEGARAQLKGAYGAATTRRSFTKERVDEVIGRPLLYSLAGLYSGVNEVIHDLSWHEWLIDTNRLLRSEAVDSAIREHYGPQVVQQFKAWRETIAAGDGGASTAIERAVGRLRQGVSAAGLGFNVMSAAMQPLGLTQSIVRVGAPWIARGLTQYIANPRAATAEVKELSSFMRERTRTRFRELNELRNRVEGQTAVGSAMTRGTYFLMMQFQQMVDVPTWIGAHEKAIADGNDDARAVALADQAVIDAQGSGTTKDLSAIEAGGPTAKVLTTFYSFMNTALNLGVAQTMTASSRGKLTADMLLLYVVPAVLGALLKNALTPGDSGDDKDWKTLTRKLAAEQISYLLGLFVVAREFSEVGKTLAGSAGRGYSGPAGMRVVGDAQTAATQIAQGEFDDSLRKAMVNIIGSIAGLPSAQANRTITGVKALKEGKTHNPAAVVFGYQEPHK